MKNDSVSASSKIMELFELHKSGVLGDKEYYTQLKSWVINQLNDTSLNKLTIEEESTKVSNKDILSSSGKLKQDEYDISNSDRIDKDADLPIKEKVEKILWIHLN
jgi:hypothetical protein